MAVQGFHQRRANNKFADQIKKERTGQVKKAPKQQSKPKLNIPTWVIILVFFALMGSGILEILRIFF
ncbi:hypothetical protein DAMA08_046860 [Martiniozyma asiatica (nom. inval.)]|nr:hypothetical protein DAMA08_046860 [Martiniozyma asiatica]